MARATAFHRALRERLEALASARVKAGAERYFRGAVPFLGVPIPAVRRLVREAWPALAARPTADLEREALALLAAPHFEEKTAGVALLQRVQKHLDASFLARLEPVFDRAVHQWGTCDAVAGHVLRPLVARDAKARRRVVAWSRARQPWRQRASAVAFLAEARHGRCAQEILVVCGRLVREDERFTQLGMGWVLRELWLTEPAAVEAFLRNHLPLVRREALRYALEKMPAPLQRRLLAAHAAARATA